MGTGHLKNLGGPSYLRVHLIWKKQRTKFSTEDRSSEKLGAISSWGTPHLKIWTHLPFYALLHRFFCITYKRPNQKWPFRWTGRSTGGQDVYTVVGREAERERKREKERPEMVQSPYFSIPDLHISQYDIQWSMLKWGVDLPCVL